MRKKMVRDVIKQYNLERAELLANEDKYNKHTFNRMINQYNDLIQRKIDHIRIIDRKRNITNITLMVVSLVGLLVFVALIFS